MVVYIDSETTGLDPRADRLVLVGFAIDDGEPVCLRHDGDADVIQQLLELDAGYCAHNAAFDFAFLQHAGYRIPPPARWIDTVLIAHVAGERKAGQTRLLSLTRKLVDEELLPAGILKPEEAVKTWLRTARREAKREGRCRPEKGDAPTHLLNPYLAADVTATRAVHRRYGAQINGQGRVLELEQRCLAAIYAAQQRGVPLDLEAAAELRNRTETIVGDLRALLFEQAGRAFNPNASRQIEAVLAEQGADLSDAPRTPRTAQIQFTAGTLAELEHPLAETLLEWRGQKKLLDYVVGLFRHAHGSRLYGTWRQLGTATGRMSSGSPNLQNIPRSTLAVRWTIAAGEGRTLVGADLDAVELRVLAAYAPGGELERTFAEGRDPHAQTAGSLGITRDEAKTLNYAILYGAGVPRVSSQLGIEQTQGRRILARWYATYPEVTLLKAQLARRIQRRGFLTTVGGRRHYFDEPNHLLLNRLISGSCADLFKQTVVDLHELGMPCVLLVHDEIVAEVPEDQAELAGEQLEAALIRGTELITNLAAGSESHHRWSQFKDPDYVPAP